MQNIVKSILKRNTLIFSNYKRVLLRLIQIYIYIKYCINKIQYIITTTSTCELKYVFSMTKKSIL